ncbi:DUF6090 family protein [Rasiella sp. SM2506]|uniref:DUF6090 family protein n=1 Tax=Rasiella sp. SM2506 TaxID=3423914 RepID=UPI003D7BC2A1
MNKFFRKIRVRLVAESKFSKYLLYAIGEIVLVVIGILIALSINNWNEKRKTKNTIKDIYAIVKSDLVADVKSIDWVLEVTRFRDSVFQSVLTKEITYDDYLSCSGCISILNGFPDIKLKSKGLTLLEENSGFLNSNQDSLSVKVIDFHSFFSTEIDVAIEEATMDYNGNRFYFKNNMTWFEDFSNDEPNEEFITYALTSVDYRNRVVSFYGLYYKIYLDYLKQYKEAALVLIETIDNKIP